MVTSFPKRTNSFLRKLNLVPHQNDKSTSDVSMAEADQSAGAPEGSDFNKSISRRDELAREEFKEF